MTKVLPEASELVEHGLIDEQEFRDFVLANPVRVWAGTNPNFFKDTVVEASARAILAESSSGR